MRATHEFYRELPKKICVTCGYEIEEQHESYVYECERCINLVDERE
jgi:predicted RNA-binding Zn-ribbon protein involved in translation (DUF1610 family)